MKSTKEETRSLSSEIINDLIVTMLINRDNLIQMKKSALRQVRELDREIKRIEEHIGKETIEKITGKM